MPITVGVDQMTKQRKEANKMTYQELQEWQELKNTPAVLLSDHDYRELLRLNHLVMEEAHRIHNNHQFGVRNIPL